jgi:hypothetical protein
MANLKFSQFNLETSTANVSHIVGYNNIGNTNVRITIADSLGLYLPLAGGVLTGDLEVGGAFLDSSGDVGVAGQVLSSTAIGTDWIATPVPWPYQYTPGDFNFLQGENPTVTGTNNTALGVGAGDSLTTGRQNTLIGAEAGIDMLDGTTNTGIGSYSLNKLTDGDGNTGVGYYSLFNLQGDVQNNTGIGYQNQFLNISGENNTTVGAQCAGSLGTGDDNTAIGYYAMDQNTGGDGNVVIGKYAGQRMNSPTPTLNTIIGTAAADDWGVGSWNTVVGADAGGINAPAQLVGAHNVLIGYRAAPLGGAGENNGIVIGAFARGHGANKVVLGSGSITSWDPGGHNTTALGDASYGFTSLVLVSPDLTAWTVTVDNTGTLVVT